MPTTLLTNLRYQIGLIGFTRFSNILRLCHYAIEIHPRYLLRLLLVVSSSLIGLPLALWERVVYGRRIAQTQIEHPPIFIIGYWRSGTTYLHNLMTQDSSFGYLSMYQAIVPDCSLVGQGWLKQLLDRTVLNKRPMDNVTWPLDTAQEDEIALCKTMATSLYTSFMFPKKSLDLFRRYVLMDGASKGTMAELKGKYYRLLQIATIHAQGKPLILKNPVNTARIELLLEMFPDAKFIHIHRSPYHVFRSNKNMNETLTPITTLQALDFTSPEREERLLTVYEEMMQRYLEERSLIPAGNLVEVRFEDLERNPLREIQRIYAALNLPSYEASSSAFKTYIDSQKSYKKNEHQLDAEAQQQVEQRWRFAFSEFGYALQGHS